MMTNDDNVQVRFNLQEFLRDMREDQREANKNILEALTRSVHSLDARIEMVETSVSDHGLRIQAVEITSRVLRRFSWGLVMAFVTSLIGVVVELIFRKGVKP